jgi:predicted alpha/beta superfamily hydrolase
VGIPNGGEARASEYSVSSGRGADYLRFLVETVKPLLDGDFRTLSGRLHTGLVGSSLGGLISLYGLFLQPEVFGFAGAMSPAFWWGRRALFKALERAPFVDARIWMDIGKTELPEDRTQTRVYVRDFERMVGLVQAKGYGDDRLRYVVEPGGTHHESAWTRRLPDALPFLLA